MNLLVLSYHDDDFRLLTQYTIPTLNKLIKKQVFITLLYVHPEGYNIEEIFKLADNNIEIRNIAFEKKKNYLCFAESFFEPENKTKIINILEEILIEKTFDIIQLDSIIFSVFMQNFASLSRDSMLIYRQYLDEVGMVSEKFQSYKLQIFKNLNVKKLTNRLKSVLEFNIKKFDFVITSVPDVIPDYSYSNNYFILPDKLPQKSTETKNKLHIKKIFFAGPLYLTETQRSLLWFINETWDQLQEQTPEIELHLYGKSEKWFTDIITKHPRVFYYSPEETDLDTFLSDKGILLIPYSRPMGIFPEFIHAIQMGKVIIAHTEAIHGWGLTAMINFMPARSRDQFIEAIMHIYKKSEIQEYFSKQILKFAQEKIDPDYLTNILVNFYHLLIKNEKHYE